MGHLTEMGDHRVGSGSRSRLSRFAAARDQDAPGEIGARCRCPEIARQCGAAVRQERPSGKPGGLFLSNGDSSWRGFFYPAACKSKNPVMLARRPSSATVAKLLLVYGT